MIREDDSHVANFERAYIANTLGAKLYLSVHNNAMDDTSYGGTMSLFYPVGSNKSSFNGSIFADIVLKKLIGKLGTTNRKAIERPNLVVLKATKMPSVIAEIAYITNSTDRANLQKETFRQKAAQALAEAVIESLKRVK
jgi:N-acetylmuramoyl-L-alanine amidase